MTARKVVDLRRREGCQRRGGGRVKGESWLDKPGSEHDPAALAEIIGDVPTPEFAATMVEQCRLLLERLSNPDLESLALAKLEGYTNDEIAARLECSLRTVERQLHLIRKKWKHEGLP